MIATAPAIPLKRCASINTDALPETTDPDFSFRYIDISSVGHGHLTAEPLELRFADAPSRARRLVRQGDTIVSTVRTYLGAVMYITDAVGVVVSTGFAVITPGSEVDPRFLARVLESNSFVDRVVARSVGVSYPAISPDELGSIPVPVPSMKDQKVIADFLDTETGRIDQLAEERQRMVELIDEWEQSSLVAVAGDWRSVRTVTLRQLGTSVVTGPFGTQLSASEYVSDAIPVVNPTHISRGRIVPDQSVTVPEQVAMRLDRHALRPGDIVLGRKGDLGRSALVRPEEDGFICGSDSIAVRTDPGRLLPEYLGVVLQVSLYRQQLLAASTGATLANVNEDALLSFRVPDVSVHEQSTVVAKARASAQLAEQAAKCLLQQVDLLAERRAALITAAVAGQLDVPTAA